MDLIHSQGRTFAQGSGPLALLALTRSVVRSQVIVRMGAAAEIRLASNGGPGPWAQNRLAAMFISKARTVVLKT